MSGASGRLVCLLALLAPLRVVGQSRCTPLGVSAKFVAPSDSGHMLVTNVSNVATKTAFCHVNCLTGLHLNGTNSTASEENREARSTEDSVEFTCTEFKKYLDCRKGCILQSEGRSHCGITCKSRCATMCEGFTACFSNQVKNNDCGLDCKENECNAGCEAYTEMLEFGLTPLNKTSLERIYGTFVYEAAPPMEASMFDKSSLVFRVEDQSSPGDHVYQWMVNVQFNDDSNNSIAESLLVDLTPYSCRTVNVSYAIATDMGMSEYSPATVIQVPGKETFFLECLPAQLEESDVQYSHALDDRAGFLTHYVFNVSWNASTQCLHKVTNYTVSLKPNSVQHKYCGKTIVKIVDENTLSVQLQSSHKTRLDLPCMYTLKVQVNPMQQGDRVYTKGLLAPGVPDTYIPKLGGILCPVTYNSSSNKYDVDLQWSAPFSPALVSEIFDFKVTVFLLEKRGNNNVTKETIRLKSVAVNGQMNYYPIHHHQVSLEPLKAVNNFYRLGIELVWNGGYSLPSRSTNCETKNPTVPPPRPIVNVYNIQSNVLKIQKSRNSRTLEFSISFNWDDPVLIYTARPIQQFQARIIRDLLDRNSNGGTTSIFNSTTSSGIMSGNADISTGPSNFTVYLQMRSYQFRDFPSAWSEPKAVPIHILDSPRTRGVSVSLRPLNLEYKDNKPTLTFDASVMWTPVDISPPIKIERYEVWVNTIEASKNKVEGTLIYANDSEKNVKRDFIIKSQHNKNILEVFVQVRVVASLKGQMEDGEWSDPETILYRPIPVPVSISANLSNPRLVQQTSANTFSLSAEIYVNWEHPDFDNNIKGYEVYIGFEELRTYEKYRGFSNEAPVTVMLLGESTEFNHSIAHSNRSTNVEIFVQIRSLSTSNRLNTVLVHEWSEPIRLSPTPLPSPNLTTVDLVATSLVELEGASGQLMASITVNISWDGLFSDINIEEYQIWVGSKALEEYEEPTSDGAMTRFESNSTFGSVAASFSTNSADTIIFTQIRSMGPDGIPRWSSAELRRTGPVSPPTVLAPERITSENPKWDPVKEQFRVEAAFTLKWKVDNSAGDSVTPSNVSMATATSNTTDVNTTSSSSSGSGSDYGSDSDYGSGKDSGTDIPTELGNVTGFLVHVGETQLSGFAVAKEGRVTEFKANERSGEIKEIFIVPGKDIKNLQLFVQMQAQTDLGFPQWSNSTTYIIPLAIPPEIGAASDISANSLSIILGVVIAVVVVLLIAIAVVAIILIRYRLGFITHGDDDADERSLFGKGEPLAGRSFGAGKRLILDEWEISTNDVIVEQQLGEGAFGEVYKGVIRGPLENPKISAVLRQAIGVPVAIKLLKHSSTGKEKSDFLAEIDMMKKIAEGYNSNIVNMVGCVTLQEPLCLITEFIPYGDLLSYLKHQRKKASNMKRKEKQQQEKSIDLVQAAPYMESNTEYSHLEPLPEHQEENDQHKDLGDIESTDLIKFAYQIATGMDYLASLNIVHRDLACRNVLVAKDKLLKITDFGLSREVEEVYVKKTKGRLPLKWMAIESITAREFTTASDVWAFGVTLWEIGTIGGFPYPSVQNEDLLMILQQGYRLEKPDNCAPEVYDLMLECWNEDSHDRPSFAKLRSKFGTLLQAESADSYIELQIDEQKPYYQVKEEDGGRRRGSVSSSSSEESIDKEKGKGKDKLKRKNTNPYVTRPGRQGNGDAYFDMLAPATSERPQQLGIPISQLVPQTNQQPPVEASTADEPMSQSIAERRTTNPYVEEPSVATVVTNVGLTVLSETSEIRDSQDEPQTRL